MTRTYFLCLTAAAALSSTAMVQAQSAPEPYHGGSHIRIVEMQDTDSDGFISSGEHGAWGARVFHAMDANNDGKLTRSEYFAVGMGSAFAAGRPKSQMATMRRRAQPRKAELFKAMDSDTDGTITGAEFMRELDRGFMSQDKNKDGKISIDEFRERSQGW